VPFRNVQQISGFLQTFIVELQTHTVRWTEISCFVMVSDEFAIANNFANIENMVINGHNISTKFKDHYQFISYSAFHASALTN